MRLDPVMVYQDQWDLAAAIRFDKVVAPRRENGAVEKFG